MAEARTYPPIWSASNGLDAHRLRRADRVALRAEVDRICHLGARRSRSAAVQDSHGRPARSNTPAAAGTDASCWAFGSLPLPRIDARHRSGQVRCRPRRFHDQSFTPILPARSGFLTRSEPTIQAGACSPGRVASPPVRQILRRGPRVVGHPLLEPQVQLVGGESPQARSVTSCTSFASSGSSVKMASSVWMPFRFAAIRRRLPSITPAERDCDRGILPDGQRVPEAVDFREEFRRLLQLTQPVRVVGQGIDLGVAKLAFVFAHDVSVLMVNFYENTLSPMEPFNRLGRRRLHRCFSFLQAMFFLRGRCRDKMLSTVTINAPTLRNGQFGKRGKSGKNREIGDGARRITHMACKRTAHSGPVGRKKRRLGASSTPQAKITLKQVSNILRKEVRHLKRENDHPDCHRTRRQMEIVARRARRRSDTAERSGRRDCRPNDDRRFSTPASRG